MSEFDDIQASNVDRVRRLYAMGVQPDPSAVLSVQLQVAIDILASDEQRGEMKLLFEQRMAVLISSIEKSVAEQKLLANGSSGLFLPKP